MRKFLSLLLVLTSFVAVGQDCGFDSYHQERMLKDPDFATAVQSANAAWSAKAMAMNNSRYMTTGYGTEYEIPVVVHIIHTGGAVGTIYNPADSVIENAIEDMNEIYQARHANYEDTNGNGVRFPVKFVLAKRTSGCSSTSGIIRIDGTSLSGAYNANGVKRNGSSGVDDEELKSWSRWNNREYYNIWVVNRIDGSDGTSGSFTAGYAQFPGGRDTTDGTVILATQMKAGETTLAHELGHAFFLYHTFQGDGTGSTCPTNTNCATDGDLICDTEPHRRNPSTCPSNSSTNICTGNTWAGAHRNFMDYNSCPDRFTAGQRERFLTALTDFRPGLGSSLGAVAPPTTTTVSATCTTAINPANVATAMTANMGPTKVVLNDLTSDSKGYADQGGTAYEDRTCNQWATVTQGESYTLSINTETNRQDVQVYIDYNNNGSFSAGELVYAHNTALSANGDETHSTTYTVPSTGVTTCTPLRMRVIADWFTATHVTNGCGQLDYGQAEDFTVYVKKATDTVTLTNTITTGTNPTCPANGVTFTASASKTLTSPSYQWYMNSQEVGTNSSTYSPTGLSSGNTYYVQCKVYYTNDCSVADSGMTNAIALNVSSTVTPSVTIAANPSGAICSGTSVTFTPTPTNGGAAPTYQWKVNGGNVATGSTYTTTSLSNGDAVTCVMTSNDACASPTTATSAAINMNVTGSVTPSVSIASNQGTSICSGTSVTFTATPTNGGTTPSYQWKVNGGNVGTNSTTYITTTLSNNDVVTCVMTSNASCASPTTATSSGLTMSVSAPVTPSVSIASGSGTTICSGTSVTFTATPTNGGSTPSYQWKVNGGNVGTNSTTYTTTGLNNNDVVTCVMTSSDACASPTTATSSGITMTVNTTVTPSVSIASGSGTTICSGDNVTFTATPTNGGSTPSYQWKVNGGNVGTNSTTYTTSTLNNNDIVTCVMTSNATCASPTTATSSGITMTVNSAVTPSVTIASGSGTTACNGASVTFTATPTNGGSTPSYQWKVNGGNVGTNSATFTTSTLANGDAVSCVMTSNASCASPATATSNTINMTVTSSVTPTATISSNLGTTICDGATVTFSLSTTNAGSTPSYQWRINGVNVPGGGTLNYVTDSVKNDDTITCRLLSSAACASPNIVFSNELVMTTLSTVTPSASISSNKGTLICPGESVTFTATPTNGGTTPSYQWKVNGTNVGTNANMFTSTTINDKDTVTCVMTSNATCPSPAMVTSNSIVMNHNATVTPGVSISSSNTAAFCPGTSVTFTATPTNGGSTPSYQWKVNGTNAGTNNATFTTTTLSNGDAVTCVMTSSATCPAPATATSNTINVTVISGTITPAVSVSVSPNDTVCNGTSVTFTATPTNGGTAPSYQWKVNGNNVGSNSATYTSNVLNNGDAVTCEMTSSLTCASPSSAISSAINMTVNPNLTPVIAVSVSPNDTICAGTNTTFTATFANGGTSPVFQWRLNGSNVGVNSSTYMNSSLADGDVITCEMTSSETCVTQASDTSNDITMTVNPILTPVVTIAVSPNDTICDGTTVTFTATPVNGGASPSYQWKLNGVGVGTNSTTYTSSTLLNGDVVTCEMISSEVCVSKQRDTSNAINMTVNPNLTPDVTIAVTPNDTICAGTTVTFTATPTNGGTSPSYQWVVNGATVGFNSNTLTTNSIPDGAVVYCVLTSSETCVTKSSDTSNSIIMKVNPILTPDVTITVSPNDTICAGASTTFTANAVNGGSAPVYQWKVNGSNVGTNSNTFITSTLLDGDVVTCVLTTNYPCPSKTMDTSNSITMKVLSNVTPVVIITRAPTDTICDGTTVLFTATSANGGTMPVYQWQVNGTNAGTNNSMFATNTLNNGDVVRVIMTSNAQCVTKPADTSNVITVPVKTKQTPDITIAVSPDDTACAGTSVTFTASATVTGASPFYQWQVNGVDAGANSPTFTIGGLSTGDMVRCILTTSDTCVTKSRDTSNVINMTIIPFVTPDVTIAVSPNDTICDGNIATFTATAVNGGTAPTYQWMRNGLPAGTNSSTYTNGSLSNGDVISCILTSNAKCLSKPKDTSANITMTVKQNVTPVVTIAVTPSTTICDGANVIFTATPTNGGTTPSYQWRVNGTNAGTNSNIFITNTLANGDVVDCIMTSSEMCVTKAADTSNAINMTVNPNLTPDVTITVSPNDTICDGTSVTFTATAVNGGGTPTYQWRLNGANVGTNSTTFTTSTLSNNDVVDCILTSSETCVTKAMDTSNAINMTVNPILTPDVTIAVSPNDTVCDGTSVTFTATPTNEGATPTYQWRVNGANVGTNSTTYTSSTLANNDAVSVILTSSEACVSKQMDTSNVIDMTVNPNLTPVVTITVAPGSTICDGTPTAFTATAVNGGTTPTYQWKLNGNNVGVNSNGFTSSSLSNGDIITCVLTSSETCVTKAMDTSNAINMTVNPLTQPAVVAVANTGTNICQGSEVTFTANVTNGGTSQAYQWRRNGTDIAGATNSTFNTTAITSGDVISVKLTITAVCPDPDTAISTGLVMSVVNPSLSFTVSPNDTICDGVPAMYNITGTNVGNTPAYQWYINGSPQLGAVADNFTIPSPGTGDVITARFTGSDNCINVPPVDADDTVTMQVQPTTAPTVSITPNPGTVITSGTIVFFNSNVSAAPNIQYQWRKNGMDIPGATGLAYTEINAKDGDEFSLWVKVDDSCRVVDTAVSNTVILTVEGVGVAEVGSVFDDVNIMPNPNNGTFILTGTLATYLSEEVVNIEVINTVGVVIHREEVELKDHELKTRVELGDKAHNGLHLIRITAEGRTQILKFIANR